MKRIGMMLLMAPLCGCSGKQSASGAMMGTNIAPVTHCVGRNAIDMPSAFSHGSITTGIFRGKGVADQPAIDVIVRSTGFTHAQFDAEVVRRRAELTSRASETVNVLRLEKPVGEEATLFRIQEIDDAYRSEVIFRRGTSLVTATLESYRNQFPSAEDSLRKFIAEVSEQAPGTAATGGGFCLGSVTVKGEYADAQGSFMFKDDKGNVFGIEIQTSQGDAAVPLLARMAAPDSLLARFNLRDTVLRAGKRTIAGMPAQEWLGWTRLGAEEDEKTFGFSLETIRSQPGVLSQRINVAFDTAQQLQDGSSTKTMLSDEAAVQLWDAVVYSIRPATR